MQTIYARSAINLIRLHANKTVFRFHQNYEEFDLGSVQQAVTPPLNEAPLDILSKLSLISPGNQYVIFDEFSRDLMLYLANDLGWGMGASIIGISLGIKALFGPLMFSTQLNTIKMKLIEPETKNFNANLQKLSQARDFVASRALQKQYVELRQRHGISMLTPFLSMLQIPILMTWFFSLRYVCSLPEQYPGLLSQGFLWFKDLSEYDPYGVLPVLSSTLTYLNMSMNPNMAAGQSHPLGRYFRYMKFLPFCSIPIVIFFPAGINLYWCTASFSQLAISMSVKSAYVRSYFGVPEYLPGTILERMNQKQLQTTVKAVIVEENETKPQIQTDSVKLLKNRPKKQN